MLNKKLTPCFAPRPFHTFMRVYNAFLFKVIKLSEDAAVLDEASLH